MRRLLPLLLLALPLAAASGEEPRLDVLVDEPRPAADDIVRLTYRFSGGGLAGNLQAPASLPLKNLSVVSGPSRSEEISFINGVVSRSLSLVYFLRPEGAGPAEVGETTWTLGEKTLKGGGYAFEVGPARGRPASPPEGSEEDPMAGLMRSRGFPSLSPSVPRREIGRASCRERVCLVV